MSGFIACPNCGSRMKAGRGHCLRCFETLPVEGANDPQGESTSRRPSQGATLIAGVVLTLGALLLSALIWENATPPVDDAAQPAVSTGRTAREKLAARTAANDPSAGGPVRPPIIEPGFIDAARTGDVSASTGNFAADASTYERALAQHPDNPETLNKLGQTLVRLGKIDEALPRFERAAALAPDTWVYHFNLAHAASQLMLWDRAVAGYRRARALQPTDYATQFDLAMALHKKGEDAAAIPEFEKAIALTPGAAAAHLSLAITLEKMGRIHDAVRAYRRFLELEPGSPDAEKLKAYVEVLSSA